MTKENIKNAFEGVKEKSANAIHTIQDPEFRGRVSNMVSSTYTSSKRAIESFIWDENEVENPLAPDQPAPGNEQVQEPVRPETLLQSELEFRNTKSLSAISQLKNDDLFEEVEDENEGEVAEGKMDLSIRETKN